MVERPGLGRESSAILTKNVVLHHRIHEDAADARRMSVARRTHPPASNSAATRLAMKSRKPSMSVARCAVLGQIA
ncbi:MAG: hypothetical protein E6J91_21375 [Deltaproteobacteria bacterium]|nr:MAG: hypothetical protein E6J91_21375 [Deltaproteobacteria bacterium]